MKNLSTDVNDIKTTTTTYAHLYFGDYLLPDDYEQQIIPPFKVRYITLNCSE